MRPRVFFVLASAAFGLVAVGGAILSIVHDGAHGLGPSVIAGLASLAFGGVAWVEPPAPRHACSSCGGATLLGLGFCTSCGGATEGRRS